MSKKPIRHAGGDESCGRRRVGLLSPLGGQAHSQGLYLHRWTKNASIEIGFIDLARSYHSVDCVLLLEVLARFGVSPWMIKITWKFHDGMLARVPLDDGDVLAWFNVYQGLRQRCELPRLVLNTFFGTVIIVALRRFAAALVIVFEMVYLDDAPKD